MEFRNKEKRAQCYLARDEYFSCLDKYPETSKEAEKACKTLFGKFEDQCGKKWTDHFIKKRDYLRFKERVQKEGIEAIDKSKL